MKIFLLANHWVGWKTAQYLSQQEEDEVVGLCLHLPEKQKYVDEIRACFDLPEDRIFSAPELNDDKVIERIKELDADICISCFWAYLLKNKFFSIFPKGCINFHPGCLPYNRGASPELWPFIEGTPAGVSLHYIDEGVDTGDIVAQRKVPIRSVDTGLSLYNRTLMEIADLFQEVWPSIRAGTIEPQKQDNSKATFHRHSDRPAIEKFDLDAPTTGRELLNLLRSRTFPPYTGCYFEEDGKKTFVQVQFSNEEDGEADNGKRKWDYTESLD